MSGLRGFNHAATRYGLCVAASATVIRE
jgi:hypothetical protein